MQLKINLKQNKGTEKVNLSFSLEPIAISIGPVDTQLTTISRYPTYELSSWLWSFYNRLNRGTKRSKTALVHNYALEHKELFFSGLE